METKEQKAIEYAQNKYCSEDNKTPRYKLAQIHAGRDGYIAGWDEALKSQWVSVEERLPEKDELVLTIVRGIGNDYISQLMYVYNGVKFPSDSKYFKVVAWMPIPSFDNVLKGK